MKRIIIADSGSTKTDWSVMSSSLNTPIRFKTQGLNPAHKSEEDIDKTLREVAEKAEKEKISDIFFYGAGCSGKTLCKIIKTSLERYFPDANICVDSDLKGAALALFGEDEGIACILGTGSNSGYFRNGELIKNTPSLGYVLGDEGSGVALGKKLLNGVFKKVFDKKLIDEFNKTYDLTVADLIQKVYKSPGAAPFIASFSLFVKNHLDSVEMENLVYNEFKHFFEVNISPYHLNKDVEIGFIGSIAENFKPILMHTCKDLGLIIKKVECSPMSGLELFHSSLLN